MKWINNALLCCVRRGSLDYELSGEQEAQQWGGSPHDAALQHKAETTEEALARTHMQCIHKKTKILSCAPRDTHLLQGCEGPRDTLSPALSEVSHTGECGRMAGRGELSSRRKIRPSRYCLSDRLERARTHTRATRKRREVIDPVTQQLGQGCAEKHTCSLNATVRSSR